MEPVSIVMLVNASFGIARSLIHTVKELYELAEAYETAALGIRTVATQCNSFRIAVQRINTWLVKQDESNRDNLDEEFWQALADNLETGRLVLEDLEKRIQGLKKNPAKFWTRTKYLWNSVVISELQSQIQGLMSALSILIQVIDIPTTGGKRSQSLAQRSRLNNLTKTVRLTVDQRRERIQSTPEQNLLDEVESEAPPTSLQEPLSALRGTTGAPETAQGPVASRTLSSQGQLNHHLQGQPDLPTTDSLPPPYEYYGESLKQSGVPTKSSSNDVKKVSNIAAVEQESTFRILDPTEVNEEKSKRSKWNLKFRKRSNPSKERSGSQDNTLSAKSQSDVPSKILDSTDGGHLQHTPAAIDDSKEKKEYFDLQQAIMGMSVPTDLHGTTQDEQIGQGRGVSSNVTRQDSGDVLSQVPSIITPPPDSGVNAFDPSIASYMNRSSNTSSSHQPLARFSRSSSDINLTSAHDSSTTSPPPSAPPRAMSSGMSYATPNSTNFDRIRPSQRVREARERSHSQGPSRDEASSPPQSTKLIPTGPSRSDSQSFLQTWRTTPAHTTNTSLSSSNSSTLRLKISFDPNTFTSRISTTAARSLAILDSALTNSIDNIPIATLTLLYTVDDGETQAVMGDEVELEVMHEEESRTAEIRFGADQMMLKELMEVGGYLYWSDRAVPKGLRTAERLRLLRRFEMVMW